MTIGVDQWIGIVGQVATWITLVIVLLTLLEMGKQRRESYKPELIITRTQIYGYRIQGGELGLPHKWSNKKLPAEKLLIEERTLPGMNLYNLGLGAAKDIKLNWDFNVEHALNFVKDYCDKNSIPINANLDTEENILTVDIEGSLKTWINLSNAQKTTYDYLLPASVTSEGICVPFPYDYKTIASILVLILHREIMNGDRDIPPFESVEIPLLKLQLEYKDLGKTKYKKWYEAKLNIIQLTGETNTSSEPMFVALLEPSEIS